MCSAEGFGETLLHAIHEDIEERRETRKWGAKAFILEKHIRVSQAKKSSISSHCQQKIQFVKL